MFYEKKVIRPEYTPGIDKRLHWYVRDNDLVASAEHLNGFKPISRDDAVDILFAQADMPDFIECADENESHYVILKCGKPDDIVFEGCSDEEAHFRIMNVRVFMNFAYSHATGVRKYLESLNSSD